MAVTVSRREERQLKHQQLSDRRPTRYWMALLISLLWVSAFTVGLSQHTLSTRLERSASQESQPPLPLSALTSPEELYPALLALYPRGGDQQLVAQSLHSFLQAEGGPSADLPGELARCENSGRTYRQDPGRSRAQAGAQRGTSAGPRPESRASF